MRSFTEARWWPHTNGAEVCPEGDQEVGNLPEEDAMPHVAGAKSSLGIQQQKYCH